MQQQQQQQQQVMQQCSGAVSMKRTLLRVLSYAGTARSAHVVKGTALKLQDGTLTDATMREWTMTEWTVTADFARYEMSNVGL